MQTVKMTLESVQYRKATIYIIIIVLSFLLLYLSLAGNIIAYTPNQGTKKEKTLIILSMKGKMPTLAGIKHLSVHFFPHGPRLFHLSTEKIRVQSVRNGHQSNYSRADAINKIINKRNKRSKKFSIRGN